MNLLPVKNYDTSIVRKLRSSARKSSVVSMRRPGRSIHPAIKRAARVLKIKEEARDASPFLDKKIPEPDDSNFLEFHKNIVGGKSKGKAKKGNLFSKQFLIVASQLSFKYFMGQFMARMDLSDRILVNSITSYQQVFSKFLDGSKPISPQISEQTSPTGKYFRISLPIYKNTLSSLMSMVGFSSFSDDDKDRFSLYSRNFFGEDILVDLAKPHSRTIRGDVMDLSESDMALLKDQSVLDEELVSYISNLRNLINSIQVDISSFSPVGVADGDTVILDKMYKDHVKNGGNKDDSVYEIIDANIEAQGTLTENQRVFNRTMMVNRLKRTVLKRVVSVSANVNMPLSWMRYYTQSENPTDVDVLAWSNLWIDNTLLNAQLPDTVRSFSNIRDENKNREPKPRTSESGLVLDKNGHMLFIPDVDNIDSFSAEQDSYIRDPNGVVSFNSTLTPDFGSDLFGEKKENTLKNRILYTDWVNNKFVYTDTGSAVPTVMNLDIVQKVKIGDIKDVLDLLIVSPKAGSLLETLNRTINELIPEHIEQLIDTAVSSLDDVMQNDTVVSQGMRMSSDDIKTGLKNVASFTDTISYRAYSALTRKQSEGKTLSDEDESLLRSGNWTLSLISPTSPCLPFRAVHRLLELIDDDTFEEAITKNSLKNSVTGAMQGYAILAVLARYAPRYNEIAQDVAVERQGFIDSRDSDSDYTPAPVALIKEDFSLLPHQASVDKNLFTFPEFAILDIDAGGGKTLSILIDILRGLQEGKWKRPLVICPAGLMRSYVREALFLTEGRLNTICVKTDTVKLHGHEKLANMIKTAPKNTVCITSVDFPKGSTTTRTTVGYGGLPVTISYNMDMLKECDFDYVAVDESHFLKKESSARQQSMRVFLADIPYRRLATGTFIDNGLGDAHGQFSLLSNGVFGSYEQFEKMYSINGSGGNNIVPILNAEKDVRNKISTRCMLIKRGRKEWQHLLPEKRIRFRYRDMTQMAPAQEAIYDALLEKALDELERKAPNLLDELLKIDSDEESGSEESGDETRSERLEVLESKLKPYVQRMEQFIAAPYLDSLARPYTDSEGNTTEGLPEDQRKSIKVIMIEEILEEHFRDPNAGKVLIFCSYKVSVQSIVGLLMIDGNQ